MKFMRETFRPIKMAASLSKRATEQAIIATGLDTQVNGKMIKSMAKGKQPMQTEKKSMLKKLFQKLMMNNTKIKA
jgi:hypothetical protein